MPRRKNVAAENKHYEGAFDFGNVMDTALEGYIERPTLEKEIKDHIHDHGTICCIIVGEPGSGKTSLASWLIRSEGHIHHFLRKGHTEFGLWSDPYGFLTSIGFQLKGIYGDAIFPQTVAMDVQNRIQNVEVGASYIGTEIKKLVATPWHSANLQVRIDAKGIRGKAVGVTIDEVIEDYRRIPLITYRQMALIDPLLKIRAMRPQDRVILWIDGLDEGTQISGNNKTQEPVSIAEILPTVEELGELGNIILVISSRPGPHLDRFISSGAYLIDIGSPKFADENTAVIESYIQRELAKEDIRSGIAKVGKTVEEIQGEVLKRCEANFLYLRHFFLATQSGDLEVLIAQGLPKSLDNIYTRLISNIAQTCGESYSTDYHPVVSTMAIAYKGLTTLQIGRFTGLDINKVNGVVARLRPFLDAERLKTQNLYSFYHRSFSETLMKEIHQDEIWYVEPNSSHGRIAEYYYQIGKESWLKLDDYGFDFLTDHLVNGGDKFQQKLLGIIGEPWRIAKRKHYNSNFAFELDLGKAAKCAQQLPFPQALVQTAKLAIMQTLLEDVNRHLPEGSLEVMVNLGQIQRAFDNIGPELSTSEVILRLAEAIRGFRLLGNEGKTFIYRALSEGLKHIPKDPEIAHSHLATLLEACPSSSDTIMGELLSRAIDIFNKMPIYWGTPSAAREIARLLTVLDQTKANEWFDATLIRIYQVTSSSQSLELGILLQYWSEFNPQAAAYKISGQQIRAQYSAVRGLFALSRALERIGQKGALLAMEEQVFNHFLPKSDPFERSLVLTEVAKVEVELGNKDKASKTMEQALENIAKIATDKDPEANLQNRKSQLTTALIAVAEVDFQINKDRAYDTLQKAWNSLQEHGYFKCDEPIKSLIRTQAQASRDLLAAYVDMIKDPELKGEVLIETAKEFAVENKEEAGKLLEEAIFINEIHLQGGMWRKSFYFNIAKWKDTKDRIETEVLLKQFYLPPENMVDWRLDVLMRLIQDGDPDKETWLKETVQYWSKEVDSRYHICNLPIIIRKLPDSLILKLAEDEKIIESQTHFALLSGMLSARLKTIDPLKSDKLLNDVLNTINIGQNNHKIISVQEIIAFIAGQWWSVDAEKAEKFLIEALLQLECDTELAKNFDTRHIFLIYLIRNLVSGAQPAALPFLLASKEPPVPPDEHRILVPGLGTPEYLIAVEEMSERDYLLALTLGEEAARKPDVLGKYIGNLASKAVCSLAQSTAAKKADKTNLQLCLMWCEKAAEAASQVKAHYLRCLLAADAAQAFEAIGARKNAQDLAHIITKDILERGRIDGTMPEIGTMPQIGYAHALGRCLDIMVKEQNKVVSLQALWNARQLGNDGLYMVLGYLPHILIDSDKDALHLLHEAEAEASELFL
jgi:hypothetical protein